MVNCFKSEETIASFYLVIVTVDSVKAIGWTIAQ